MFAFYTTVPQDSYVSNQEEYSSQTEHFVVSAIYREIISRRTDSIISSFIWHSAAQRFSHLTKQQIKQRNGGFLFWIRSLRLLCACLHTCLCRPLPPSVKGRAVCSVSAFNYLLPFTSRPTIFTCTSDGIPTSKKLAEYTRIKFNLLSIFFC